MTAGVVPHIALLALPPEHTAFDVTVVPALADVSAADVDRLAAGRSVFVRRPWLLLVERMRGGHGTAYSVCRDREGRVVGVCPFYWGPSARGFWDPFGHFLVRSGAEADERDWRPAAVVGARSGYGHEFLVDPTLGSGDRGTVLALLVHVARAAVEEAGAACLSLLYAGDGARAQLVDARVVPDLLFLAGVSCVLDVRWSSLEEYVASRSRITRRNIRLEIDRFREHNYRVVDGCVSDWATVAAHLLAQAERKHGHDGTAEREQRELETIAELLGDDGHILAIESPDGRVRGVVLCLLVEDTIYARAAGFDYAYTGHAFEHFNLGYYELIRFAIEHGFARIDYGMGAYRAKVQRGARLEPLWGLAVSRTGASITDDARFRRWDERRRAALAICDRDTLDRLEAFA